MRRCQNSGVEEGLQTQTKLFWATTTTNENVLVMGKQATPSVTFICKFIEYNRHYSILGEMSCNNGSEFDNVLLRIMKIFRIIIYIFVVIHNCLCNMSHRLQSESEHCPENGFLHCLQ